MNNKGFTLIELLVVIAIIGILSAVVLASLNDARDSAKESAIIQQVDSLAKLLELNSVQTPGPGYSSASTAGWISGDGSGQTCDNANLNGLTSDNQTKFREICNSIHKTTGDTGTYLMYYGWRLNHAVFGNYYTFVVRTENGWTTIICAGSSGGRYVGPLNPGTGNYTGSGCSLNP